MDFSEKIVRITKGQVVLEESDYLDLVAENRLLRERNDRLVAKDKEISKQYQEWEINLYKLLSQTEARRCNKK